MKKIAVFSANAQYKIGGAETCIKLMVDQLERNYDVTVVSGQRKIYENEKKFFYKNIKLIPLINLKYFRYFRNYLNYFIIYKFFKKNRFDIVIGNCSTCLGAINATIDTGGAAIYYVHEEFSINTRNEYDVKKTMKGILLRKFKLWLDYPFYLIHCKRNSKALKNSRFVIANSRYISNRITEQENIIPEIIYPFTETKNKFATDLFSAKYITMVGCEKVKGLEVFLKIAKLMPNDHFRVVGRTFKLQQIGNVLYHPFYDDVTEMYKSTKILLVPSLWQEAFGKVSIEASAHSIPVIVSNRGGLPETVFKSDLVVMDYCDPFSWINKIQLIEIDIEYWGNQCKLHAEKFDVEFDNKKIKSLIMLAIADKYRK